ncbi:MAG TPA: hypothetical protein VFA90_16845 [Terriglobales bacterium]|nr:hypothetical protein [Terriglobales bacterium]
MILRFTFVVVFLFSAFSVRAGEVLDRVVVTVNGHVILLSDWDDELRYESFMSARKLEGISVKEQRAALNHLIDQELVREQMRPANAKPLPPEQIAHQLETIRAEVLRDNPGSSWQQVLSKYRLSQDFIHNRITTELQQLQLVDSRFRPSVHVSQAEIEQYYKDQLVPKLPIGDPVSLSEVAPKIREILLQDKVNQMVHSWLESLRTQAQIKALGGNSNTTSISRQVGAR